MPTDLPLRTFLLLPALAVAALALAACVGDGPGKVVAEAAGMATTPQESKAFVRETRPSDPRYIPIGTTIEANPLCPGPNPPPAYVPAGQAARFAAPKPDYKPGDPCKARADFQKIEGQLEAKRQANEASATEAQKLGVATTAPNPAKLPTN